MRQTATGLNRTWITIVGLLLLIAGLAVVGIGTGVLEPVAASIGWPVTASSTILGSNAASAFTLEWVVGIVVVAGIVLALLGLAWLGAQVPRSNEAKPFRLHDTAKSGLTRCAPSVLSSAVETQVKALPGVQAASAVLRGSSEHPDLTLRVTASDRTDIPRLLNTLQTTVAGDVGNALDTRLARLGVQIEVDIAKVRKDEITV